MMPTVVVRGTGVACGIVGVVSIAMLILTGSRRNDEDTLRPFEITARSGTARCVLVDAAAARDDRQLNAVADELLLRTIQTGVLLVRFWADPAAVPRRLPETCDNASAEVARISINLRTGQRTLIRREQFRDANLDALECHQRVWRRTAAGGP